MTKPKEDVREWEKRFDRAFRLGEWFFVGQDSKVGEDYLKWNKKLIRDELSRQREELAGKIDKLIPDGKDLISKWDVIKLIKEI